LQKTWKKSKKRAKFSHGPKTGQKTKGLKMFFVIELPLIGSLAVAFSAVVLFSFVAIMALLVGALVMLDKAAA
jgi:hypothetical protein